MALHLATMGFCAVAIRTDAATTLAWALLVLNGIGAVLAGLSRWLDESSADETDPWDPGFDRDPDR